MAKAKRVKVEPREALPRPESELELGLELELELGWPLLLGPKSLLGSAHYLEAISVQTELPR